ncbi:MAG: hypothetical protein JWN84_3749 [Nocardioides sp.]|nr:hypothetical protein [Nocardioides sp.]
MSLRLVTLNSTGQVSGAERVLVRTVAAAVADGWEVECLSPPGPLVAEVVAAGAHHREVPDLVMARGRAPVAIVVTLLRWLQAAWRLRRAARRADVVLVNTLTALPALRLSRTSTPSAWLAHDVVVARSRLALYRACRSALTGVVAVSAAVAERLEGPGGPVVTVVHNGVAPQRPQAPDDRRLEGGAPVVGLNGILTPWKGQQVLLDATWMLSSPARLELMGGQLPTDADHAARLRSRLDGTPLGERVDLLGHVSAPLDVVRGWTVAVSASTDPEACPLGVLEAMSLGVPVVATDHGGAPEVLDGAGLLVRPGDASGLAAAINRLLDDPELRASCAARGLERVRRHHDLGRQTALLLDTLRDLAGSRHPQEARR